ncbi:hypothetical protein HCN44_003374 [Aphidius gifuensis]|uniref:Uncharacterized protein n=1 Tax=Aphidius gifuensis TaxID=684658 RepID=A0A834XZW9_APHGI|nr:hypothetical protein HCN44_003374 [Aphidius gifuensis]
MDSYDYSLGYSKTSEAVNNKKTDNFIDINKMKYYQAHWICKRPRKSTKPICPVLLTANLNKKGDKFILVTSNVGHNHVPPAEEDEETYEVVQEAIVYNDPALTADPVGDESQNDDELVFNKVIEDRGSNNSVEELNNCDDDLFNSPPENLSISPSVQINSHFTAILDDPDTSISFDENIMNDVRNETIKIMMSDEDKQSKKRPLSLVDWGIISTNANKKNSSNMNNENNSDGMTAIKKVDGKKKKDEIPTIGNVHEVCGDHVEIDNNYDIRTLKISNKKGPGRPRGIKKTTAIGLNLPVRVRSFTSKSNHNKLR